MPRPTPVGGVEPRSIELCELWVDHDLTLACLGYCPGWTHGLHLDREVVCHAAMLGLAFDLDFYIIGPAFDVDTRKEVPRLTTPG